MLKSIASVSAKVSFLSIVLLFSACASSGIPKNNISYLTENAARAEVMVTDTGLQYEVVKAANGRKPNKQSLVKLHFVGSLTNGTEFSDTRKQGEPSPFPLSGTIPGLVEGVQLMSVGSIYRFVVPSDLAYEDRANGKYIRPGSTLIYEVELLEFE